MRAGLRAGIISVSSGGGGGGTVSIDNQDFQHVVNNAGTAQAGYNLDADGNVYRNLGGSLVVVEAWLDGGLNSDYQARATVTSGALTYGTTGTWLACSGTNTWGVTASGGGGATSSATFTLEIRMASSPFTVLDSAGVTVTAVSNDPL